jgi:hypothetical protein
MIARSAPPLTIGALGDSLRNRRRHGTDPRRALIDTTGNYTAALAAACFTAAGAILLRSHR